MLRIVLSRNQLMAGASWPILKNVAALLPHLETKWIPSLRAFLCSVDSKIEIHTPFLYQLFKNEHGCIWVKTCRDFVLDHDMNVF
jgi:hypothetical protein